MTELEAELLARLVGARFPLGVQAAIGLALVGGYYAWSRLWFATLDVYARRVAGGLVRAHVVWVERHTADYETPFESGFPSYLRWTWGIEAPQHRTLARDAAVATMHFVVVALLAALWIPALVLGALVWDALSYVVFLPVCLAVLFLHGAFWAGRDRVAGMR